MKLFVVLLIVAVASAVEQKYHSDDTFGLPRVTQIFGNIQGSELDDTRRMIGSETVLVDEKQNEVVKKMVVFPKPGSNSHVHIDAIAHYDGLLDPSVVTIVEGGVGHDHVKLEVQSKPGQRIESFLRFYGKHV